MVGHGQRMMAQMGNYTGLNGQMIRLHKQLNNQYMLEVGGVYANCSLNLTQEMVQNRTRLYARLSDGNESEVKIMPDMASQTAMERLRLKNCSENCSLQLKEVRVENQSRLAYEVRAQKESKLLGLFRTRMEVQTQIDANTGEVLQVKEPWWAFLAT